MNIKIGIQYMYMVGRKNELLKALHELSETEKEMKTR